MSMRPLASMTVHGRDLPALGFCHESPFDRNRFDTPKNVAEVHGKPFGGVWLSPIIEAPDAHQTTLCSGWSITAKDIFGGPTPPVWPVSLRPDTRVLRINSHADFEAIYSTFFPAPRSPFGDVVDSMLDSMLGRGFDYEAIAEHFDALWLTERGAAETRHTQPGLNLWDGESVLVLRADAIAL